MVNPHILRREIAEIEVYDPGIWDRLLVDGRAGVISDHHVSEENHTQGELWERI
ncbi:hypothetical protein LCGC14_2936340, partial [marine sediment metagenome]